MNYFKIILNEFMNYFKIILNELFIDELFQNIFLLEIEV